MVRVVALLAVALVALASATWAVVRIIGGAGWTGWFQLAISIVVMMGVAVYAYLEQRPSPYRADVCYSVVLRIGVDRFQLRLDEGLLALNAPDMMRQGAKGRVEVAIARFAELKDSLIARMRADGAISLETIKASDVMEVDLRGDAFLIVPLSPTEQLIAPTAHWEYDITPRRAGRQTPMPCRTGRSG
jgi:hypothetical protein